jgi:hypothetical protein
MTLLEVGGNFCEEVGLRSLSPRTRNTRITRTIAAICASGPGRSTSWGLHPGQPDARVIAQKSRSAGKRPNNVALDVGSEGAFGEKHPHGRKTTGAASGARPLAQLPWPSRESVPSALADDWHSLVGNADVEAIENSVVWVNRVGGQSVLRPR